MTACLLASAIVMITAVNGWDNLLYLAFILLALHTWVGELLTVQTGMYYRKGETRNRVIVLLNAVFDAGAITYLTLWAINKRLENLTLLLLYYFGLAVILYCLGAFFWSVTVPEEDEITETKHTEHEDGTSTSSPQSSPNDNSLLNKNDDNVTLQQQHHHQQVALPDSPAAQPMQQQMDSPESEDADHPATVASDETEYVQVANRTPGKQLLSAPFILLNIYWSIHLSANMFTMTTARDFLAFLGDDELGNKYLSIFTLLTPVSICGVPFVGKTLDRYGFHAGLQTVNLLGCLYQIIKISSNNLNVQVAGFVIFSFFRSFFFGVTFSFLPSLLSSDMVGKATGLMYAIGAAFSFINIPMAALAVNQYDGNFFIPNLMYTILVVPCVAAAWGLGYHIEKEERAVINCENPPAPLEENICNQAH